MNILIIEDIPNKAKQISDFLKEKLNEPRISIRQSYQSGLKELFEYEHDVVLLDMQLPNFDIKSGEDGYKFRKLAGVDILNELKRKNKKCNVIIVTQFETFGEGESFIELADLKRNLKRDFSGNYIETVYYNPSQTAWKMDLHALLTKINTND
jgi:DNA-binding NarL/FixJ family response regulator